MSKAIEEQSTLTSTKNKKVLTKLKKKLVKKPVKDVVKPVKDVVKPVKDVVKPVKDVVKKAATTQRKINNKPVLSSSIGINISPAKVKNIISNFILNKEMYSSVTEIKKAEPKKIIKMVDGKSIEEEVAGTPLTELSKETRDYISYATKIYEDNQYNLFTRSKVAKMNIDTRKNYMNKKNNAKSLVSSDNFNLYDFNLEFDPQFYSDYSSEKKLDENKTEWKSALEKITKLKNRFSTNSRVILSALIECLIKQLVLNGTVSCVADKKKIIQLSHVLDTSKEGFDERFPLYAFIVNLETFKQAKEYIKNQTSDENSKHSDSGIELSIDGLSSDKQYQFRYYIGEICRDVRMDLCNKSENKEQSDYNFTSVSKILKNFCSTIACEFLIKIGLMLKKEIQTRHIKTVNDAIINTVISHYHTVCSVDETNTMTFINNVLLKYNEFIALKQEKRKNLKVAPVVAPGDMKYEE
jgi:hypothetical protein